MREGMTVVSIELVDALDTLVTTASGVGRILVDLSSPGGNLEEGARDACEVLGRSLERAARDVSDLMTRERG